MTSVHRQMIYHRGRRSYLTGPACLPNGEFASYCPPCSLPDPNKTERLTQATSQSYLPSSQEPWKNLIGFKATLPCAKTKNNLTELWLTIHPYVDQDAGSATARYGNIRIFHIRPAPANQHMPDALGISQKLGFSLQEDPLERQGITTVNQVSLASDHSRHNSKDEFLMNAGGRGALFRSKADVMYLDKLFWRQYFEDYKEGSDVLIPGVNPHDLQKIRNVAVDIALLRNTREFEAVVKTIVRHMPNVKSFLAMVTSMKSRPRLVPSTVVAVLNKDIEQETNEEIKAWLGLHDDPFKLCPPYGIVGSNLRRLNFMGLSDCQWRYVQLTYYEDTFLPGLDHDDQLDFHLATPAESKIINEPVTNSEDKQSGQLVDMVYLHLNLSGPSAQAESVVKVPKSMAAKLFDHLYPWCEEMK